MRRSPVVGVLLAAGRGSRFDPDGTVNKLLAALPDGTPVAVQAARHLRAVLDDVVAVVLDVLEHYVAEKNAFPLGATPPLRAS
ncbi:NTP transferase domain-containing protein, partial [Ralstonia pseudosolanacearum]|uniref:NTP transferase domain-containing protein n=1 Tax=Ralstonia pseudosolanacearum TaxID=1310165 RepID=UPI003CF8E4DE